MAHVVTAGAAQAAAYSALTASPKLQQLALVNINRPLSLDVWTAMFNPQHVCQQLTQIQLAHCWPYMTDTNLEGLVQACPGVQNLELNRAVVPGMPLDCLLQLQHLTSLKLSGLENGDCQSVLANLTGLRHLAMLNRLRVSEAGLMHLTALKQLTHLYIDTDAFFTLLLDPLNVHVKHFSFPAQPFILQVQPDLEEEGSVWVQLRDWLQQDRPAGLQRGMAGMRI